MDHWMRFFCVTCHLLYILQIRFHFIVGHLHSPDIKEKMAAPIPSKIKNSTIWQIISMPVHCICGLVSHWKMIISALPAKLLASLVSLISPACNLVGDQPFLDNCRNDPRSGRYTRRLSFYRLDMPPSLDRINDNRPPFIPAPPTKLGIRGLFCLHQY